MIELTQAADGVVVPVHAQPGARRNAMVASTALAARRAERQEVEDFFAAVQAAPASPRISAAAHR